VLHFADFPALGGDAVGEPAYARVGSLVSRAIEWCVIITRICETSSTAHLPVDTMLALGLLVSMPLAPTTPGRQKGNVLVTFLSVFGNYHSSNIRRQVQFGNIDGICSAKVIGNRSSQRFAYHFVRKPRGK
jgi:hypothetical protein